LYFRFGPVASARCRTRRCQRAFGQIKDVPNSFVVNDDVERGLGSKIPLWLFGFLY